MAIGIFLWLQMKSSWSEASENEVGSRVMAVILFVVAAMLPFHNCTYLDFTDRQVITVKACGWFEMFRLTRPLTHFSHIVIRHLCHADEGGETYSGGVGLKPRDGTSVLWVKSFPAAEYYVPMAAYEFAEDLGMRTGLQCAHVSDPASHEGCSKDSVRPKNDLHCLKCGNVIKDAEVTCGSCGWTWK
jgi:hypothetical protein